MATQYATITDLSRLSLASPVLTQLSDDTKNKALLARSSFADSFLRGRFQLPLVAWEDDLRQAVCDLAAYDLVSVRGFNPEAGADVNFRLRSEDAIRWLTMISKEQATPAVTDSSAAAGPGVTTAGGPRMITGTSRGFSSRNANSGRRTNGGFEGD